MRFHARRMLTHPQWRNRSRGGTFLPRLIRGCGIFSLAMLLIVMSSRTLPRTNNAAAYSREVSEPPPTHFLPQMSDSNQPVVSVSRNNMKSTLEQQSDLVQARVVRQSDLQLNEIGVAKSNQFPSYHELDESPSAAANIAFFLQLSESSIKMAPRLVDRLWHERNIIVIHVDAKASDSLVNEFKSLYSDKMRYSNVHFLPRESITYMGVTMILNTLSAIEYLLTLDQHWDYFINVSGSCYPTVSVENMRMILGQPRVLKQKVSFVQFSPSPQFWLDLKKSRFDILYHDPALGLLPGTAKETKLLLSPVKHPLKDKLGIRFVHSEAWVTAHRSLAVAAVRNPFARRLLVLLSNAKDAEEHFWPTLAWNVPELNRTLAHHAMRSVYWKLNGEPSGQHPYTIDQHREPNGQYSFWSNIVRSPAFFVRKFSTPDSELMTMIDKYKSGFHPEADMKAVRKSLKYVVFMTMCHADIEEHWNSQLVVPCFKGGNL